MSVIKSDGFNSFDDKLLIIHDYFNIISLPFIIITDWIYLINPYLLGFDLLFYLFIAYMLVDFIWLLLKPKSVGSPVSIMFHHVISVLGFSAVYFQPRLTLIARLSLLVECNTWLNILKRYYKTDFIYKCFYVTWFLFRVILYPVLTYLLYNEMIFYHSIHGTFFCSAFVGFLVGFLLCILNYKWSYDLIVRKGYLGVTSKRD